MGVLVAGDPCRHPWLGSRLTGRSSLDTLRPRSDAGPGERGGCSRAHAKRPACESLADRLGAGAAGVGNGAGCGTHSTQGLRGRGAKRTSPRGSQRLRRPPGSKARPFGRLPLRERRFSLTGRPSGEQGSIRRVCRVRDGPSRFSGMNLAKPETVIECRRTGVLMSSGSGRAWLPVPRARPDTLPRWLPSPPPASCASGPARWPSWRRSTRRLASPVSWRTRCAGRDCCRPPSPSACSSSGRPSSPRGCGRGRAARRSPSRSMSRPGTSWWSCAWASRSAPTSSSTAWSRCCSTPPHRTGERGWTCPRTSSVRRPRDGPGGGARRAHPGPAPQPRVRPA